MLGHQDKLKEECISQASRRVGHLQMGKGPWPWLERRQTPAAGCGKGQQEALQVGVCYVVFTDWLVSMHGAPVLGARMLPQGYLHVWLKGCHVTLDLFLFAL